MKKAFLVITAVLLALMVFTCENSVPQPGKKSNIVGYTADGRAIVELDVGTGKSDNSRALHKLIAEGLADFYEVIFVDPNGVSAGVKEIYRTNWREGKVAKLRVPTGVNYDNDEALVAGVGRAYIFAGRYSDKTLLGVGYIDTVFEGTNDTGAKVITVDATDVVFVIEALETDITGFDADDPSTPLVTERPSTFQQKTPAIFDAVLINIDEIKVPVFPISENDSYTDFTFDVTVPTTPTLLTTGVIKVAAGAATGTSRAFLWEEDSTVPPTKLKSVTFPTLPAAAAALTFPIDIRLTPEITDANNYPGVKADPGLCKIFISIPVYLYDNATQKNGKPAETWYFRGGANNTLIDYGYDIMSSGGAILIAVGPALGEAGALIIRPK